MSIGHLADAGLPFNRKERYFTGTVLPMLVCADNFAHFDRLTELAGLGRIKVDATPASTNVQFFTEYGFAESLVGAAKKRFRGAPTSRETPDVMIYVAGSEPALLAIEAKMYDRPSATELKIQLAAQKRQVDYLASQLGLEASQVAHVALLPARLAGEVGTLPGRIVTWEQIRDTFADVAPPYFVEVLRVALERYDALAAARVMTFGANAEVKLTGTEIHQRHHEGTLSLGWMGRAGGLHGMKLAKDLVTGGWRKQRYECSSEAAGKPNWFTVAEFVAKVDALGSQPTGGSASAP
ncbi:hypothetical protein [Polyangium jinanense]|uniref:Uncharacterized protein n=1 Tax=Polyangium jinanense TaxID=2829994 RepID=A0A9X4AVQ2_9BACT|nr:hypothetical protein [Polyangium jinanense]MDC3985926.1 hypothetical protein [Polyangium jinanense]